MDQEQDAYDDASREAVELANRLADADETADLWDISDGLLAGAVQYWLYARQPCDDPQCEDCGPLCTAERRLQALKQLVDELARTSEYFHSPNDFGAGRA